jgi:hypothetical protein
MGLLLVTVLFLVVMPALLYLMARAVMNFTARKPD